MRSLHKASLTLLVISTLSALASCAKPTPAPTPGKSDRFAIGQVWTYKTRPGESASRLLIARIDSIGGQNVVHIKVIGLALKNPMRPATLQPQIGHSPIAEDALAASVVSPVNEQIDLSGFQDGYDEWLSAYKTGKAGWFTIPVAEIIATIEEALAKVSAQP